MASPGLCQAYIPSQMTGLTAPMLPAPRSGQRPLTAACGACRYYPNPGTGRLRPDCLYSANIRLLWRPYRMWLLIQLLLCVAFIVLATTRLRLHPFLALLSHLRIWPSRRYNRLHGHSNPRRSHNRHIGTHVNQDFPGRSWQTNRILIV